MPTSSAPPANSPGVSDAPGASDAPARPANPPDRAVGPRGSDSERNPAQRMDQMYRWTRHVYDATRKYYLLGRDRVIDTMARQPAGAVLEIGCGTARNLRRLAGRAPQHALYGMDASRNMLDTARRSLQADDLTERIRLSHGLAGHVSPAMFGRAEPFDIVFCSYVLSMIPASNRAVEAALTSLRPGGRLYVVDFWDQASLPTPFARLLQRWLALFDVHHRPELLDLFRRLDDEGRVDLRLHEVGGRYAYVAEMMVQ